MTTRSTTPTTTTSCSGALTPVKTRRWIKFTTPLSSPPPPPLLLLLTLAHLALGSSSLGGVRVAEARTFPDEVTKLLALKAELETRGLGQGDSPIHSSQSP